MNELRNNLNILLESETQTQRLDKLIRQGMMPARQLPILHRALANIKMGKILAPYEREALSSLLDKMMGFQFGDDVTYNRARLHTQKTKYQTEEITMSEEDVKVFDGSEDDEEAKRDDKVKKKGSSKQARDQQKDDEVQTQKEHAIAANRPSDKHEGEHDERPVQGGSVKPKIDEPTIKQDSKPSIKEGLISDLDSEGMRQRANRLGRKFGKRSKEDKLKALPAALRKEKQKAGVSEELEAFNELYKENLERALANNKVDNVRDIPESIKGSLFKHVEEATYSDKHIKMAKGIAFDKRYRGTNYTGAANAMDKIKKGLSSHPEVLQHLKHANEQVENPLEEGALKDYAHGHGYFDDSGEGKRKRADPNWLDKQGAHGKKTLSYPEKKVTKRADGTKTFKTESKIAKKDHDGDGKIETKKDEYFGSKDKAIKKAMKESEETDTPHQKAVKKAFNPNQAIRDVHATVRDVLRGGHTAQVSDVPLVTDPSMELNQGTGNHFDNDVQEGAKEDAMRDIAKDSHGLAPTKKDPPKAGKSKHDGSDNKGPDHIVAQLRKAISLGDKHDGVKFQDGKTHKVKAHHAHKFLNKYMSGKPVDKEKMQSHGHASHDNFKTHID